MVPDVHREPKKDDWKKVEEKKWYDQLNINTFKRSISLYIDKEGIGRKSKWKIAFGGKTDEIWMI